MTNRNPYSSPSASLTESESDIKLKVGSLRYVVILLVVIQLLAILMFSPAYFELALVGIVHPLAFVLGGGGSLCLYAAAILLLAKRPRGESLFLIATGGLALSIPMLRLHNGWVFMALPFEYGALLGILGWWVTRSGRKSVRGPDAA